MAKVILDPPKKFNKKVANLAGVKRAVRDEATKIKGKAEANLNSHRREGHAQIGIESAGGPDVIVFMESPNEAQGANAAAAIEFGHRTKSGKYVAGLSIITRAAHG